MAVPALTGKIRWILNLYIATTVYGKEQEGNMQVLLQVSIKQQTVADFEEKMFAKALFVNEYNHIPCETGMYFFAKLSCMFSKQPSH